MQIDQRKFIEDILVRFGMDNCRPISTPMEQDARYWQYPAEESQPLDSEIPYRAAVGCLNYLAITTRPDLAYVVSWLSKFVESPNMDHWEALKRVLRYLCGTNEVGIKFHRSGRASELRVLIYSDSDWSGDLSSGRSTTGVVSMLSSGAVLWTSKRQNSTAQSSAEAEYMALGTGVQDAIWMTEWLAEIGCEVKSSIAVYSDSSSAIAMSENPISKKAIRHVRVKYHLVRENVAAGLIQIFQSKSSEMWADMLTKGSLSIQHFVKCREAAQGYCLDGRSGSVVIALIGHSVED